MLNFIVGGAGSGKSHRIIEKIAEQDEQSKQIIIVPDQFSFEFDKRLYKMLGAKKFNSVTVLSFTRLASEIFRIYGGKSGEYIDDVTKTALIYMAVRNEKRRI